jgi:hypothetical protein
LVRGCLFAGLKLPKEINFCAWPLVAPDRGHAACGAPHAACADI